PELSATSSMVLIITAIVEAPYWPAMSARLRLRFRGFGHQGSPPDHFLQSPPLQLGKRARFLDLHDIAQVRRVLLVVGVKLLGTRHHPPVQAVGVVARDF